MLLRYKMMPSAGTSPLILLGLQWWPLNPPRGVCPGSASAYRLDEVWVGSSGTVRRVKAPPSPCNSLLPRPPGTHGLGPGLLHACYRRASTAQTPAAAQGAAVSACQSRRLHCC